MNLALNDRDLDFQMTSPWTFLQTPVQYQHAEVKLCEMRFSNHLNFTLT